MRSDGVAIVLLIAATAGCSPALLWYGHDPQRTTRLELRAEKGRQWIAEEIRAPGTRALRHGRRSGAFDAVAVGSSVWSTNGRRFAFAAQRQGQWHIVADFVPGPPVDAVIEGTMTFSTDGLRLGYGGIKAGCARVFVETWTSGCLGNVRSLHLADAPENDIFLVEEGRTPVVMWGGSARRLPGLTAFAADAAHRRWAATTRSGDREKPTVTLIADGGVVDHAADIREMMFSPTGQLAYFAQREGGWYFVAGNVTEGPYSDVRHPVFSANGARHGYIARTGEGHHDRQSSVVVGGVTQGRFPVADGLVFSADGRRMAYVVRRGADVAIVCDGLSYPFDVVIETTVAFSADGRHWAALVGTRRDRKLFIVVDGKGRLPFDTEELFGAAAEGAADLGRLREWVAAELEHHLRGGRS